METIFQVYETTKSAVEKIRQNGGPILIEAKTYRHEGHDIGDPEVYRSSEEVEQWKQKDPLLKMERDLLARNILTQDIIDQTRSRIQEEIDQAVQFAFDSPEPPKEELLTDIFVKEGENERNYLFTSFE